MHNVISCFYSLLPVYLLWLSVVSLSPRRPVRRQAPNLLLSGRRGSWCYNWHHSRGFYKAGEGSSSLWARDDNMCLVRTDQDDNVQVVHIHAQGRTIAPFSVLVWVLLFRRNWTHWKQCVHLTWSLLIWCNKMRLYGLNMRVVGRLILSLVAVVANLLLSVSPRKFAAPCWPLFSSMYIVWKTRAQN
jgi:hypothetical protein